MKVSRFVLIALVWAAYCSTCLADFIYIGGDNIGDDGSSVNGNGAVSAHGGNLDGPLGNRGNPAIPYTSDGKAVFDEFRIIAAMIPDFDDGGGAVDWSNQEWVLAIYESNSYLNELSPLLAHSFGSTPGNWSGFNQINSMLTVPDTVAFGNYGNTDQRSEDLYDLRFSASNIPIFDDALPIGDYFITLQSVANTESYGEAGVGLTVNGLGPEYWYDNNQMLPQSIYPNLTSNPDLGIAFSVRLNTASSVGTLPEPSSGILILLGICSSALVRRQRRP